MDINLLVALNVGAVILISFLGNILFTYTKVPPSFFMICIGLFIGPFLKIVDQALFVNYMPLVSTLTLIIVLLDSGLSMNLVQTFSTLGKAIRLEFYGMFFSILFVGGFMYAIGWELIPAILMGVISSGITTIAAVFMLSRASIPNEVKQMLILESIIDDLTLIVVSVLLLQVTQLQTINPMQIIMAFVSPITLAIGLGVAFVLLWAGMLLLCYGERDKVYIFTLGILFLLHACVDGVGGSSPIAIVVFSLTIGNVPMIINAIQEKLIVQRRILSEHQQSTFTYLRDCFNGSLTQIKKSQTSFSFFMENFFFVYLGIIFDVEQVTIGLVGICLGILVLVYASRYVAVRLLAISEPQLKPYALLMSTMIARGFTATFTAFLPASMGIEIPQLKETMLLLVLVTNFAAIIGSSLYERRSKPVESPPQMYSQ